jgi:ADP-ribose pyrophosphatase YjhB (NUDIX family)
MHHIQRSIILSLARTSPLRFSDLQPPRVPNNTFTYHLKKLISGGYVEVTKAGYIPTRKALKLVTYGSTDSNRARTPGTITMLYVENEHGEILLLNRNRKPFQGWYGIPGGWIHLGETADVAAQRELTEKTTLVADSGLKAAGVLELQYVEPETDDIFLHVLSFVYVYKYTGDIELLNDKMTTYGQLSWLKDGMDNVLPEVQAIRKLVAEDKYSYASETYIEPPQLLTV